MQDHIYKYYMDEIGQYPRLTLQEERALSNIIINSKNKAKVSDAVNKMVMSNLRLAAKFALKTHQYHVNNPSIKMSLMDYVQEANKAIIRAAQKYNAESSNARFGTYAVPAIQYALIKASKNSRFVRLPEHQFAQISMIEKLYLDNGDDLTDEMIMEELSISKKYLDALRRSDNTAVVANQANALALADLFVSPVPSTTTNIKKKELREYLLSKIKQLTPMERDAVFFIFFGDSTNAILAKKHNVSSQRVSQAFLNGLKKLRKKISIEHNIIKEHIK